MRGGTAVVCGQVWWDVRWCTKGLHRCAKVGSNGEGCGDKHAREEKRYDGGVVPVAW